MPDPERTTFARALLSLDGVGRVTASRLLQHFASYDALRAFPREQVLARLKGAPNAASLVERLFDEPTMRAHLEQAKEQREALQRRRVELIAQGDAAWPEVLDDLPRSERPVLLHLFGNAEVLARPLVALFADPPLSPAPFEQAQALVRHLLGQDLSPATGTASGFDIVVHKLAATGPTPCPSLLVAPCGMARLAPKMRPTVSMVVKAGGLFVSPFEMSHGPFPHDDRERALVLAALAATSVFFEPKPDTVEWHALHWLVDQGRSVFGVAAPEHPLPATVHPLATATDFDWVVAATQA